MWHRARFASGIAAVFDTGRQRGLAAHAARIPRDSRTLRFYTNTEVPGRMREVVYAPSSDARPLSHVKSTLIASSRQALTRLGFLERYSQHLSEEHATQLREAAMRNTWLPVSLARQHYEACDAMGASTQDILVLGNSVAERVANPIFGTLVRIAKKGGVTPWAPLSKLGDSWSTMHRGGSIAVYKVGPKDAEVHILRNELGGIPYWVQALAAFGTGITEMFAKKAFCRVLESGPLLVRYRIAWA